jgi:hypothetical protein
MGGVGAGLYQGSLGKVPSFIPDQLLRSRPMIGPQLDIGLLNPMGLVERHPTECGVPCSITPDTIEDHHQLFLFPE